MKKIYIILAFILLFSVYNVNAYNFTNDIIGYWNFSETSGKVSPSNIGGEYLVETGSAINYTTGIIGNARGTFSTGNKFQNLTNSYEYNKPYTFSMWVKITNLGATKDLMGVNCIGSGYICMMVGYNLTGAGATASSFGFEVWKNGQPHNNVAYTSAYTINTSAWYHVVGVYNGSNMKVYANGVLGGTQDTYDDGAATASTPLWVGGEIAFGML